MTSREAREELLTEAGRVISDFQLNTQYISDESGIALEVFATIVIARDFIGNKPLVQAYLDAPDHVLYKQPVNDGLLHAIITHIKETQDFLNEGGDIVRTQLRYADLRDTLRQAIRRLRRPEHVHLPPADVEHLSELMEEVEARLDAQDMSVSKSALRQTLSNSEETKDLKEQTKTAASDASKAAGKTGEDSVASHYQELADTERKSANRYRALTTWTSVVAGGSAVSFLLLPQIDILDIASDDYVHLIQRIVVTAAIFGLAAYFAKQAHQHRALANWASTLAVQLKAFSAYSHPITQSDVRDDLRRGFAARAFGEHPAMKGESNPPTPGPASLDAVIELATKLAPGAK